MIARAKQRGYVTYDELNKVLPSDKVSSEQIEDTMSMLNEMGINVIESEEQEEGRGRRGSRRCRRPPGRRGQPRRPKRPMTAPTIRCACICARWARSSCSSREGEIAIAKRIEAGRELMIGALCESPLTFEALTVWRDELNEGKVLLRDIIDLEAMYGGGPDGQPRQRAAAGAPPIAGGSRCAAPAHGRRQCAAALQPRRSRSRRRCAGRAAAAARAPQPAPQTADGEGGEAGRSAEGGGRRQPTTTTISTTKAICSLSAMEAALKPQVLETLDQIAGALQEARQAAGRAGRSRAWRRRAFHQPGTPLQEAAQRDRRSGQEPASSTTTASKRWSIRCTASTAGWSSLEGKLLRLAEAHGVDRADFLKQYFGNELDPNWARRVGRLTGSGWKDFVADERDKIRDAARRDPGAGAGDAPVDLRFPPHRADGAEGRARSRVRPRRK